MPPQSPNKRRKSNSAAAIPVSASNTAPESQNHDSPLRSPSRPSFQAPTRASLARHHPDVLSRVIERSTAEKARRPASQGHESKFFSGFSEGTSRLFSPGNLPPALTAGADRLLPSPEIRRIRQGLSPGAGSPRSQHSPRRPRSSGILERGGLHPPRTSSPIADTTAPQEQIQSSPISHDSSGRQDGFDESLASSTDSRMEPGLPPTPTELGLQRLTRRQLSLLSSSPSSRLEMMQKQKLKNKRIFDFFGPKSKNVAGPPSKSKAIPTTTPPPNIPIEDTVPQELKEKKTLRDGLSAQLKRLREEVTFLENEAGRLEHTNGSEKLDERSMKRLIELITTTNPSCAPSPKRPPRSKISSKLSFLLPFSAPRFIPRFESESLPPLPPPPKNPYALEQPANPIPYLTVFAPLSLTNHTTTSTDQSQDASNIIQTHHLVLSPPPNFPKSIYQVPIILKTNPEEPSVISISLKLDDSGSSERLIVPSQLTNWLESRLSNPLLERDISGLCWGICRYWEAAISRAKLWMQLQNLSTRLEDDSSHSTGPKPGNRQKGPEGDGSRTTLETSSNETKYPPRALVPNFNRTNYRISTTKHTHKFQLLVSCHLSLDLWTSEPELKPDICISCPSPNGAAVKIEKEAKNIFRNMLKRGGGHGEFNVDVDAFVKAVEAVAVILFGHV